MINANEKYKTSRLSENRLKELTELLLAYVEEKRIYQNPILRMNQLAFELNIQNHILSQVINRQFNMSFFEFINTFRINKAIEQITNNADKKMKIASIGYYCGFNTRTTFVKAFKERTGVSPSEYKLKIITNLKNN